MSCFFFLFIWFSCSALDFNGFYAGPLPMHKTWMYCLTAHTTFGITFESLLLIEAMWENRARYYCKRMIEKSKIMRKYFSQKSLYNWDASFSVFLSCCLSLWFSIGQFFEFDRHSHKLPPKPLICFARSIVWTIPITAQNHDHCTQIAAHANRTKNCLHQKMYRDFSRKRIPNMWHSSPSYLKYFFE